MPSDRQTRKQRHQAQVKTQAGKAIRGAQATEFVKGSGYRKTEFIGGKKFFTAMSSDPNASGAGGDVTNITVTGSTGAGGDVKSDGTVHFTAPQTGVAPTDDLHLATKKYVDDEGVLGTNSITVDKLQQVSTDTFLGRDSSGTGNVEVLSLDDVEAMLQLNTYLQSASTNSLTDVTVNNNTVAAGHYLRYNGTNFVNTGIPASDISGLQASQIPALPAGKITSDTFANAQISESSVTQHSTAVKSSASLMSNFFLQEADNSTTSVGEDHKIKIVTNNGGGHGTGTISTSGSGTSSVHTITLNTPNTTYTAGSNITFNGTQINATDTNTNQLTRFYMRDDDNDAVYMAHNHYIKLDGSGGITTNWNATDSAGTSGDPHILTIGVSNITSVGTITSGVWQGTRIDSSYLDTNVLVDNSNRTITGIFTFNGVKTNMYELNINGSNNNATNDATLYVTSSSDNDWGIKLSKPSNEYGQVIDIAPDSSHALRILGNGTQNFNVKGDGKTSINTTTATYGLNVGTSGAGFWGTIYLFSQALYSYNGSSYYQFYNDSNVGQLKISDTSGSNYKGLTIDAGGTALSSGRVKIDTQLGINITTTNNWSTTPSAKLVLGKILSNTSSAAVQINGGIRCTSWVVLHDSSNLNNSVYWYYTSGGLRTGSEGSASQNVYAGGDVVAYYSSDPRLKTNKKRIEKPLTLLSKINGYTFDWKKYASKFGSHLVGKDYGVMADEIEEVMPELVEDRDNGYKGVKYEKIVPLLIECIKEQQVQIDQLKKWKENKKWI